MVLPLYLAMNASEMSASPPAEHCAWMACHFSSCSSGISNLPEWMPPRSMLILNDRIPCQGHSPDLIAGQVDEAINRLSCESLLLDFQRPENPETEVVIHALLEKLTCPVAISECYATALPCPVFLAPNPPHIPMDAYLAPWKDREIWLEAALCQENVSVTEKGAAFSMQYPTDGLEGGFYDDSLRCHYHTRIQPDQIQFTLFDTPESLEKKLNHAQSLGISRAVGLYQELGAFLTGKLSSNCSIAEQAQT